MAFDFSTVDDIRSEAGFKGNLAIDDTLVEKYRVRANRLVEAIVGSIYDLTNITGVLLTGSQTEGLLTEIVTLWGAGSLLLKEYGSDQFGNDDEGTTKQQFAQDLLNKLCDKDCPLKLLDSNNEEFDRITKQTAGLPVGCGVDAGQNKLSVCDTF